MKIDDKYKWLARDKDGQLCAYENKPEKIDEYDWYVNYKDWHSVKETDKRFSFIKWEDSEPIKISDIGNILAIDSSEVCTYVHGVEPLGVSILDSTIIFKEIGLHLEPDKNDIISKPSHYIGINGLEVEEVTQNFLPRYADGYVSHRVGSAIEYLLRAPLKNRLEDIEKAKENLQQIIDYENGKSRPLELDGNESDISTYYGGTNLGD